MSKSLEIVNKIQNDLNECFSRYDVSTMTIQKPDFYAKEWEQIKQDLEILEILQVLILHNGKSVGYKGIISDFEVMFRLGKITKEQLDKIKQWLEEND